MEGIRRNRRKMVINCRITLSIRKVIIKGDGLKNETIIIPIRRKDIVRTKSKKRGSGVGRVIDCCPL